MKDVIIFYGYYFAPFFFIFIFSIILWILIRIYFLKVLNHYEINYIELCDLSLLVIISSLSTLFFI